MIKGRRKGKIFILSILIIMLFFIAFAFCGCEKRAKTIGTDEALGVLSKIDLSSKSFSAEVSLKNNEINKINATYLINGENEKFYLRKEKGQGDFVEQTLYKVGGEFYLYENSNDRLLKLASYEYSAVKAEFMAYVYNKDAIILNDSYEQMQIYDFYGFAESLSLVGGSKKGDEITINLSCPTIINDLLFYKESKLSFNGGDFLSIETNENVEQTYLSGAVREEVALACKSWVAEFDYGVSAGEIKLPSGEQVEQRKDDVVIIYDISPLKIGGVSEFAVVTSFDESGLSLSGVDEVLGLIDSSFNFATFGYEFGGWFSDVAKQKLVGNGGDKIVYPQIDKIRLYGKFEMKQNALKATLNYAGAVCLDENADSVWFESGSSLADVVKLVNVKGFYELGYHFDGVYSDRAFKNRVDDGAVGGAESVLNENVTLYLKFSKNVKIVVDGSGITNQLFRKYYINKSLLYSERVMPYKRDSEPFVDYYLEKDFKTPLSSLTDEQIALKGEFTVYPKFGE